MKQLIRFFILVISVVGKTHAQAPIPTPPMGWNSFDSYGVYLYHDVAVKNIDEMAARYLKFGYNYFVIDAGWFGEFKLKPGTKYPNEKHAETVRINEFGIPLPSETYFPQGLKVLADRAHSKGLKFGIHVMRGIPRVAVHVNTKVKGTKYRAKDIADTTSVCTWNHQFYGVNMEKPGAQEYYNSLVNQFAAWGVDFIKSDDIVPFPQEIEGMAKAIALCGRPIVLSLSPGGNIKPEDLKSFRTANMLRVTPDIWDDQIGLDQCFKAWRKWMGNESDNFFIDMDMIPFGELQIQSPKTEGLTGQETKSEILKKKATGELSNVELLSGKGWHRRSELTKEQMFTFITLRALAASPLMIGGDLVSMDEFSYKLLTNKEIIACNQNGVMGNLVYDKDKVETWKTTQKGKENSGWIGIFNRDLTQTKILELNEESLGLKGVAALKMYNVWDNKVCRIRDKVVIIPNSCIFIKYRK